MASKEKYVQEIAKVLTIINNYVKEIDFKKYYAIL